MDIDKVLCEGLFCTLSKTFSKSVYTISMLSLFKCFLYIWQICSGHDTEFYSKYFLALKAVLKYYKTWYR